MPSFQPPSRQPKKIYSWRGGIEKFLARTGLGLGRAGEGLFKEFTKPGPQQQKSNGKLSSAYLTKGKRMELRRVERMIEGSSLSKREKRFANLRFRSQVQNPEWSYQQNFSQKERKMAEQEIRDLYGDSVANEVARKWEPLFRGKASVTGREAMNRLGTLSNFRAEVREGIPLIIRRYDQKPQLGNTAKYITEEKLGNVIRETEEKKSGKYPGQILRKSFMVTEGEEMPKETSPAPKSRWKISALTGWGRKNKR